jgi:nitroimidazol reductase NimA-like FMN-containing flavoprotein (pyridoxamine 5'-phosphate oxidase superfamily)
VSDKEEESASLEEIPREECLELLNTCPVGRFAVATPGAPPLVVPVNYLLDGDVILFRTDPGEKVFQLRGSPVSFQIDQIDPHRHTGWTVLVQGVAYEATPKEIEHLALETWAPGDKTHWIRIAPGAITGRRIRLPQLPTDGRAYL